MWAQAGISAPPNSGPRQLFRGALVAPASALLCGPQLRSGSAGWYLGPRIAVPGHFFGAPWWPPPAPCSMALSCGLAARAGISAPRTAVPGHPLGAPWWPPPAPCSVALNCGLAARAGISAPPNSSPRPLFRGALVAPASALLHGPQLRSGSEGRYLAPPPPKGGSRPPFRGALVAPTSALLRGPQLRSGSEGRYLGPPPPPNSSPRPLFRGALVASASALLRGPQFQIAWLSVATETIGVRRNKYRFCILHIYVMKPITWQPSRI